VHDKVKNFFSVAQYVVALEEEFCSGSSVFSGSDGAGRLARGGLEGVIHRAVLLVRRNSVPVHVMPFIATIRLSYMKAGGEMFSSPWKRGPIACSVSKTRRGKGVRGAVARH